jgi:hypothetical protein
MIRALSIALLTCLVPLPAQTLINKDNLYFFVDASSFSAEGTWIPVDPKSHAAYQTETQVDCDRAARSCMEATAEYFSGHPHISVTYFQIIKWDGNGIVASNADAVCVSRTLTIGFAAKHLTDTRESKVLPKSKEEACKTIGVPASESWTMALKNSQAWADERDRDHMK